MWRQLADRCAKAITTRVVRETAHELLYRPRIFDIRNACNDAAAVLQSDMARSWPLMELRRWSCAERVCHDCLACRRIVHLVHWKYDARQYMDRLYQDDFAGESFLFRVLQARTSPQLTRFDSNCGQAF